MNYNFQNFKRVANWSQGPSVGAIRISPHHHICAMMSISAKFDANAYAYRLDLRSKPRVDLYGFKLDPWPKLTKHELMALDMDHILSCVFCPEGPDHGWAVEMWTNDREDQDWIKFVQLCPYAFQIYNLPSRMGPYNIQGWLFARKDPRK